MMLSINYISLALHRLRTPSYMTGPAIWLVKSPEAILHRKLVVRKWSSLRAQYSWPARFLTIFIWHGFYAWVYLIQAFLVLYKPNASKRHEPLKKNGSYKTIKILFDLVYLSFWLGVKPKSFFSLELYLFQRSKWLSFIFPQEQPFWHSVHNREVGVNPSIILSNKHELSVQLKSAGIASIETFSRHPRSTVLDGGDVFLGRDLFIKPNSLNAMRGCLKLEFNELSDSYSIAGYDLSRRPINVSGQPKILETLNRMTSNVGILIQPVLRNHSSMSDFLGLHDITTIKLITAQKSNKIKVINATLEMPNDENQAWHRFSIAIDSGFIDTALHNKTLIADKHLIRAPIPFWDEVKLMALRAHQHLGPLTTSCWDICIAESGPVILEGNAGWDLVSPQKICHTPLLSGFLLSAYLHSNS